MSFAPVVCALDLAPESQPALLAAVDLAARADGELHLVTVRRPPESAAPDSQRVPPADARAVPGTIQTGRPALRTDSRNDTDNRADGRTDNRADGRTDSRNDSRLASPSTAKDDLPSRADAASVQRSPWAASPAPADTVQPGTVGTARPGSAQPGTARQDPSRPEPSRAAARRESLAERPADQPSAQPITGSTAPTAGKRDVTADAGDASVMSERSEYEYLILDGTTSGGLQPVVGTINTLDRSDEAQSARGVDFNILSPSGEVVGRMLSSGGPLSVDPLRYYYHKDLLGSVRAVVTDRGSLSEQAAFDPWGVRLDGRLGGGATREGFTGKPRLDALGGGITAGLDDFGARTYAPAYGRFVQIDPHAASYPGWTPYNYVGNNPLAVIDPDGQDWYQSNASGSYKWFDGDGAQGGYAWKGVNFSYGATNGLSVHLGAGGAGDWNWQASASQVHGAITSGKLDAASLIGVAGVPAGLQAAAMDAHMRVGGAKYAENVYNVASATLAVISFGASSVGLAGAGAQAFQIRGAIGVTKSAADIGLRAGAASTALDLAALSAGSTSRDLATSAAGLGTSFALGAATSRFLPVVPAPKSIGAAFRSTGSGRYVANRVGYAWNSAAAGTAALVDFGFQTR